MKIDSIIPCTLLVIPVLNEQENIGRVISDARAIYPALDILVIDDYSTDDTLAVIQRLGVDVLSLPINLGYGAALQAGYKYALQEGYDVVIQMDGDGQHTAESIRPLLEALADPSCSVVIGTRFYPGSPYRMPLLRRIAVSFFRMLIRLMTGQRVSDPTSGLQALKRNVFTLYADDVFPTDYPDADVIVFLHKWGLNFREVPVVMHPSTQSMHRGPRVIFYLFKVLVSMFAILLEGKQTKRRTAHAGS